jgi:hypothetical protein
MKSKNMGKQQPNAQRREPRGVSRDKTPTPEQAILTAAMAIGKSCKDGGKPVGDFEALAVKQPKLFAALLGRLLACDEAQSEIPAEYEFEWKYLVSEDEFYL